MLHERWIPSCLTCCALSAVLSGLGTCALGRTVFLETFEGTDAELRGRGWGLPGGAAVEPSTREGPGSCLHISRPDKRGFAEINVPVESGKVYRGRARVKCRDARGGKGAVLFLQFSDADREHVNGGSFPVGLHGTQEWQELLVHHTIEVPENVAYVRVTLGLDETGEAWFDDVELAEVADWTGPEIVAPAEGAVVDTAVPEFRWQSWQTLLARLGRSYGLRVELSRDPEFGDAATQALDLPSSAGRVRVPFALADGRWHWRVNVTAGHGTLPPSKSHTFTIPEGTPVWPPQLLQDWSWSDASRPELAVTFSPHEASVARAEAWVNGRPAAAVVSTPGRLAFRPSLDLPPGIHEVNVTLHPRVDAGHAELESVSLTGIFCNKQPASRVTFRDDGIMLVNGSPTFPIGAYRDPSDREDVFDGLLEVGFDVTHSYRMDGKAIELPDERRAYLERAHANGISVFLGMPRGMVRDRKTEALARYVAETMDTPGLLAWYQFDEPEIQNCSPEDMMATYRAISAVDPFHPTITLVCSIKSPVTERFRAYGRGCDVFWEDPYPVPSRPLLMVEEKVLACREAVDDSKPVWCVIQGFSWAAWKASKTIRAEHSSKRTPESVAAMRATGTVPVTRPDATETRCMAHLAISAGAKGLIWYWSPNSAVHAKEDSPEVWAGIKATVRELRELMPWLVAKPTPGDAISVPAQLRCWSRFANGKRVIVLINPESRALTFPPADLPEQVRAARSAGRDGGLALEPHGVVVMRTDARG